MKARDDLLLYDSHLQPKDKLGLTKDEILMKEFEPDGTPNSSRKGDVFYGCGQDQLPKQLSKPIHRGHEQKHLQPEGCKRCLSILLEEKNDHPTKISYQQVLQNGVQQYV